MYEIVTYDEARAQLDELPEHLVTRYLEVRAALETAPWTAGHSSRPSNPDANVYTIDLEGTGDDVTVWYAIAEEIARCTSSRSCGYEAAVGARAGRS